VDEVKLHAFVMKRLLHRLVELAGEDRALAKGVQQFLLEAAFNLGQFVQSAAAQLPPLAEEFPCPLQVEAPGMGSEGIAAAEEEASADDGSQSALQG
jgi:hypothetical protein